MFVGIGPDPMGSERSRHDLDLTTGISGLNGVDYIGCKISWPFFVQKPPALTSIDRRKSVINHEIASNSLALFCPETSCIDVD